MDLFLPLLLELNINSTILAKEVKKLELIKAKLGTKDLKKNYYNF